MREFVNNNSKDEIARYNLAIMCEQLNYTDMAKDHYSKILENNSQHWKSKFNLYLIYICRSPPHRGEILRYLSPDAPA